MSVTDQQLLRDYSTRRSEPAFAELVRRHVDLVYSAALRMVCDAHLAEDVTQEVFVALAQNSRQLVDRRVLSGWLHCAAQNLAANAVRSDVRRHAREQEAAAMNELFATEPDALWEDIAPHLDAALGELSEPDRDAVLLRFFERKSAREMAQMLGTSEGAAQKRVSRAVERLREFFARRGVAVGASGLVVVISANAVQAAPVGLAVTISTAAAITGTTIAATATATATKAIAMTALQKTLITATIAAAVGTGIYEAHQASTLRTQVQTVQQQQAGPVDQIQQLNLERDDATRQLAALRDEHERLVRNSAELVKLRDEVSRLRREAQEFTQLKPTDDATSGLTKKWLKRVTELKQLVEQRPDLKIPELQFLTTEDWLRQGQYYQAETEDGIRATLAEVRHTAKGHFVYSIGRALNRCIAANNGQLPNDILQLKPYFDSPVEDAMLQRYGLQHTGKLSDYPETEPLVTEKAPVDDEYDYLSKITAYGSSCQGIGRLTGGGSSMKWEANLAAQIKPFAK